MLGVGLLTRTLDAGISVLDFRHLAQDEIHFRRRLPQRASMDVYSVHCDLGDFSRESTETPAEILYMYSNRLGDAFQVEFDFELALCHSKRLFDSPKSQACSFSSEKVVPCSIMVLVLYVLPDHHDQ